MNTVFEKIETQTMLLRTIELADAPVLFSYWSDPMVARYMNIKPFEKLEQATEMIGLLNQLAQQEQAVRWAIVRKRDQLVMGSCGFNNWDKENRRAEIGYELGQHFWRQGIMTEVLSAMVAYGFAKMELNRIQALVEPANKASLQLLQKLGFQQEGILRQYERVKEQYIDLIMAALLKSEISMHKY